METQTYANARDSRTASGTVDLNWVHAAASAARFTARKRRLRAADAEDLRSEIWLKLLRNDKAALRQFGGRSSLESFLITIADRCALDQRVREFGKWRPSRAARETGASAILIERLTIRDGLPIEQAVEMVRASGEAVEPAVRHLAEARSRVRTRLRFTQLDAETKPPADPATPETICADIQTAGRGGPVRKALRDCLTRLPADDLHLLKRRFLHNEQIADIARADGRDQKALYRTVDRICRRLRDGMAALGVTHREACALLGSAAEPLADVLASVDGRTGVRNLPR